MNLSTFLSFFFSDPAPTQIYTLSLHDALPISESAPRSLLRRDCLAEYRNRAALPAQPRRAARRPRRGIARPHSQALRGRLDKRLLSAASSLPADLGPRCQRPVPRLRIPLPYGRFPKAAPRARGLQQSRKPVSASILN